MIPSFAEANAVDTTPNPPAVRRIFLTAAVYGILVLAPQVFMEADIGRKFPPAITHPELFYGFIGVALAWQIVFLVVASDAIRFRPVMVAAVLEKCSFGFAAVVLYAQGRIVGMTLVAGLIDLLFAALFAWCFLITPKTSQRGGRP